MVADVQAQNSPRNLAITMLTWLLIWCHMNHIQHSCSIAAAKISKFKRASEADYPLAILMYWSLHINGLMQDCSISVANALEILQSRTKPPVFSFCNNTLWIENRSRSQFHQQCCAGNSNQWKTCFSVIWFLFIRSQLIYAKFYSEHFSNIWMKMK